MIEDLKLSPTQFEDAQAVSMMERALTAQAKMLKNKYNNQESCKAVKSTTALKQLWMVSQKRIAIWGVGTLLTTPRHSLT